MAQGHILTHSNKSDFYKKSKNKTTQNAGNDY